jgi:lysophospholipase L1-like esterase
MEVFPFTPVAGNWGSADGADPAAWLNTHAAQVAKIAATPNAEILLIGDSITSQWGGGQMPTITPAWTANFGTTPFVNLGIGGDKTYNVLWRLDHANLVGTINPKVVVLQIGHNNMNFLPETGLEPAVDGVVWCVRNLRSKFPTTPIIVVNVFPTQGTFMAELKLLRAALNARNLPATDPLVQMIDIWDQLILPSGLADPALMLPMPPDNGVHLDDDGYKVWAAALKPLITAINAPTVRYDANGASSGTAPSDATVYANRATVTVRANSGTLSKSAHQESHRLAHRPRRPGRFARRHDFPSRQRSRPRPTRRCGLRRPLQLL